MGKNNIDAIENSIDLSNTINLTKKACGNSCTDIIDGFIKAKTNARKKNDIRFVATCLAIGFSLERGINAYYSSVPDRKIILGFVAVSLIAELLFYAKSFRMYNNDIDNIRNRVNLFRLNRGLPELPKPQSKEKAKAKERNA